MIIPKIGNTYTYNNKNVGIIAITPLFKVYVIEYTTGGSHFLVINWWKFAKNAIYTGQMKNKNSAY